MNRAPLSPPPLPGVSETDRMTEWPTSGYLAVWHGQHSQLCLPEGCRLQAHTHSGECQGGSHWCLLQVLYCIGPTVWLYVQYVRMSMYSKCCTYVKMHTDGCVERAPVCNCRLHVHLSIQAKWRWRSIHWNWMCVYCFTFASQSVQCRSGLLFCSNFHNWTWPCCLPTWPLIQIPPFIPYCENTKCLKDHPPWGTGCV